MDCFYPGGTSRAEREKLIQGLPEESCARGSGSRAQIEDLGNSLEGLPRGTEGTMSMGVYRYSGKYQEHVEVFS